MSAPRELQVVLQEFYGLLRQFDAGQAARESLPERLCAMSAELEQHRGQAPDASLEALLALLRDGPPPGLDATALRRDWVKPLQAAYDELAARLRDQGAALPILRPNNYARNVMHITTGVICLLLIEYVLSPTGMILTAAAGALVCWSLETGRIFSTRLNDFLLKVMGAVAHPHERRHVNSATWYTTALLILALLFTPKVCAVALAVLCLADPAAGLVGRRWGRIRLLNGRSLEGTLAFFVVGTLSGWLALALWHPEVKLLLALLIAGGAALPAALVELVSRRIDDNFLIPLAAAAGAWAVSLSL